MHIAIDESGSFVHTEATNSWSCVVAYVYPEHQRRPLQREIQSLKRRFARNGAREVKLRDLSEEAYIRFLRDLGELDGICLSVATDSAINTPAAINRHQIAQVEGVKVNVEQMIYQEGRDSITELANRIEALADQLYVQMNCQVVLVEQVLKSAILYFVQRNPATLGHFRWRIDQKNSEITAYETAYIQVLAPFMQSRSIREPMTMLEGADYSWFDRHRFPPGEAPTYLRDHYGIDVGDCNDANINIGQILREHVDFVDSRDDAGVQVADLLASGLRRCLREQFEDNESVATLLGGIMVQQPDPDVPIRLVSLGESERVLTEAQKRLVLIMKRNARAMLAR